MTQRIAGRSLVLIILLIILTACSQPFFNNSAEEPTRLPALQPAVVTESNNDTAPISTPIPQVEVENAPQTESAPVVLSQGTLSGLESSLISVYEQANPAVVYVSVPPIGSGSGFVFDDQGHIITNNHVVDNGSTFDIIFPGGEQKRADLIGTDVDSDLAVLKVDSLPDGVAPLPLSNSETLRVGQLVVAIGSPFGEQGSMSLGIVSGLGRSITSQRSSAIGGNYSLPQVIQTDAPINPGNSGGPLLDLDGEVVGVNSAIATFSGSNSGVGFSIPVNAVRRIIPALIATGEYAYPYVGAGFEDEISIFEQSAYALEQTAGAYVLNVTNGSPAQAAGLRAANPQTGQGGDLIIDIDGRPIRSFNDLNSYLVFNTSVGQTIQITTLRGGERVRLSLTLGERPYGLSDYHQPIARPRTAKTVRGLFVQEINHSSLHQ